MLYRLLNSPRAYPAFYEPYYDDFDFYNGREAWLKSILGVPTKAVHLFTVHWLHLEVYNGGFWQYFYNSTGTTAPEAAEGFVAIGMRDVGQTIEEAMVRLGTPFPGKKIEREKIVGPPVDPMDFGDLDSRFYELADTDTFFRKLPKFVPFADAYAAAKN